MAIDARRQGPQTRAADLIFPSLGNYRGVAILGVERRSGAMSTSYFSDFVPPTTERVPRHTDHDLNRRIARETELNVGRVAVDPKQIDRRLEELDREWDIERALEANAAAASLIGLSLGRLVSRRWYFLPTAVATFLLQHALQGWCPPVSVFRRFGIRTQREIDEERYALKLIRGDFDAVHRQPRKPVQGVMEAIRR
jgi:hypothetical protein